MTVYQVERERVKRKIIRVSKKRQITIPLEFFNELKLSDQVECSLEKGAIVIRPLELRKNDEFSVEILKELVAQGYSGDELINQFEIARNRLKQAVDNMLDEADRIAEGLSLQRNMTTYLARRTSLWINCCLVLLLNAI